MCEALRTCARVSSEASRRLCTSSMRRTTSSAAPNLPNIDLPHSRLRLQRLGIERLGFRALTFTRAVCIATSSRRRTTHAKITRSTSSAATSPQLVDRPLPDPGLNTRARVRTHVTHEMGRHAWERVRGNACVCTGKLTTRVLALAGSRPRSVHWPAPEGSRV